MSKCNSLAVLVFMTACQSTTDMTVVVDGYPTYGEASTTAAPGIKLALGDRIACRSSRDSEWCQVKVDGGASFFTLKDGLAPYPLSGEQRFVVRAAGAPVWTRPADTSTPARVIAAKSMVTVSAIPGNEDYVRVIGDGVVVGFVMLDHLAATPTVTGSRRYVNRAGVQLSEMSDGQSGTVKVVGAYSRGEEIEVAPLRGRPQLRAVIDNGLIAGLVPSSGLSETPPPDPPEPPGPMDSDTDIFIWGGGKTRQDAIHELRLFEEGQGMLGHVVRLGPGYPRIVASQDIPGLNPGFWIVVLGMCQHGVEEPEYIGVLSEVFAAVRPRIYSKEIPFGPLVSPEGDAYSAADHCPDLAIDSEQYGANSVDIVREEVAHQRRRLVGLFFGFHEETRGDFMIEVLQTRALFLLYDGAGKLIDRALFSGSSDYSEFVAIRGREGKIVFAERYADPPCHNVGGTPIPQEIRRKPITASIVDDGIVITPGVEKVVERGMCDGFAAELQFMMGPPERFE